MAFPGSTTFPGAFPGAVGATTGTVVTPVPDATGGWVFTTPTVTTRSERSGDPWRMWRLGATVTYGLSVYRIDGAWHTSFGPGPDLVAAADRFYGGARVHEVTDEQAAELVAGGFGSHLYPLTAAVDAFPGTAVYPALLLFPSD